MEAGSGDDVKQKHMLHLAVDEANVAQLESMSCQEIVDELEARTMAAYRSLPGWDELCDRYGDRATAFMLTEATSSGSGSIPI